MSENSNVVMGAVQNAEQVLLDSLVENGRKEIENLTASLEKKVQKYAAAVTKGKTSPSFLGKIFQQSSKNGLIEQTLFSIPYERDHTNVTAEAFLNRLNQSAEYKNFIKECKRLNVLVEIKEWNAYAYASPKKYVAYASERPAHTSIVRAGAALFIDMNRTFNESKMLSLFSRQAINKAPTGFPSKH